MRTYNVPDTPLNIEGMMKNRKKQKQSSLGYTVESSRALNHTAKVNSLFMKV